MNRITTSLAAFAGTALLAATALATTPPAPPAARPAPPVQRPAPPRRPLPPRYRPAPPPAQTANPDTDHHHGDHWRDHHQDAGPERHARDDAWRQRDQKHRDEMRQSRASRRKAREAELRKKWGDKTLQDPKAHDEMQTHSWRKARLERLRTLAQEDNRQDLVTRIDKLEKEEQARHDTAMAQYKGAPQ